MANIRYLSYDKTYWACDIEADGYRNEASRVWCVCVENIQTGERLSFEENEADEFVQWFHEQDRILVGHNFLSYDAPVLNRLWETGITVGRIIDTFIMSQMYAPNLGGGHSLAAWGIRLKHLKGDHSEFHVFTPAMLKYCQNDAALTAMVYKALAGRMRKEGFSERGIELEHKAWNIIQNKQKQHGFPFDQEKADTLYAELRAREAELKEEIYRLWPPVLEHVRTFARACKSDGTPTANYQRHLGEYPILEINDDGSYNAFDYVQFDLGSPKQRIQKLLDLGWEPVNFTEKGSPKIDEDEMLAFAESSGITEAKALARWCVVNARANMVRTWMNAVNPVTGNIHGSLFLAATGRYKHSKPNTANIPATRHGPDDEPLMGEAGTWAFECRSLWTAGGKDWVLVGMDGKGMQSRCLAHNTAKLIGMERGQEFIDDLLVGDIHKKNIERFGFPNKPAAKKAYYCVPMHTQALTKKGWMNYDELEIGELVLTYNQELNIKEWMPVLEKVYFEEAPVIEMGHSRYKVQSTPQHRWFTEHRLTHTPSVTITEDMNTMQNIVVNAPMYGDRQPSIEPYMKNSKYGTDWMAKVLDMSHQERESFLAGFCIADGYQAAGRPWRWTQLRGPLFEAALLASYLVHDGALNVSTRVQENGNEISTVVLNKKQHVSTAHFEYNQLPDQPVWCIRTENESWVMRQGDCITITGNTIFMGGGGAKIALDQAQFGWHIKPKDGTRLKDGIIGGIAGFKDLIDYLQAELRETGRITLCDGTKLSVPSDHMVIPYLLQGDESRLMKQTMIYIDAEIRKRKLTKHILKVGDIHDEFQFRCRKGYEQEFVDFALPCFERAGESFGYLIPNEGDAKIGDNWSQTH